MQNNQVSTNIMYALPKSVHTDVSSVAATVQLIIEGAFFYVNTLTHKGFSTKVLPREPSLISDHLIQFISECWSTALESPIITHSYLKWAPVCDLKLGNCGVGSGVVTLWKPPHLPVWMIICHQAVMLPHSYVYISLLHSDCQTRLFTSLLKSSPYSHWRAGPVLREVKSKPTGKSSGQVFSLHD